ncbi:hypothetical protein PG994_004834 [Apiospora phragmitis]|uniref:F-box domain-containing protein n=1 Tax=Apiospora phragmitis TaxID=2905665 RepID=A0ABR1VRQ9_9PEZI
MDHFPFKTLKQIIQLAFETQPYRANLSQYATVSRKWQIHVEFITFETIYLDTSRLSEANQVYDAAAGIGKPRLAFPDQLPPINDYLNDLNAIFPSVEPEQHDINNGDFSDQVARLFDYLHGWHPLDPKIKLSLRLPLARITGTDTWRTNHHYSRPEAFISLRPDVFRQLPRLHFIVGFSYAHTITLGLSSGLWLHPKACCEIASRFPSLESIDWHLEELVCGDNALEVQIRNDFAAALNLVPASVWKLALKYDYYQAQRGILATPGRCPPGNLDPLSVALRRLSKQLEEVTLEMVIGPEFFPGPPLSL